MIRTKRIWDSDGSPIDHITDVILPAGITSLIGGGGKTSSMLAMGQELASKNHQVIMTTTTHIMPFEIPFPDNLQCVGIMGENGKLGPLAEPDSLVESCEFLLIEADGSRGLPIKAPADHEPVITEGTELVIALVGLKGIGKPIGETCHRPKLVCDILGKCETDIIEEEDIVKLLLSPKGYYKNVKKRRYAVILNQADTLTDRERGSRIAKKLPEEIACIMTSYREDRE